MPSNNKKGFFSYLMSGDFGLSKTYWLYLVLPTVVFNIATKPLLKNGAFLFFGFAFLFLGYIIPAIIGVWRASNKYQGKKIWPILAKILMVLQWLNVAFIVYISVLILIKILDRAF